MKVKKILAGFLSAAMIFSLMPTTVFATESDMPGDESSNAPVVGEHEHDYSAAPVLSDDGTKLIYTCTVEGCGETYEEEYVSDTPTVTSEGTGQDTGSGENEGGDEIDNPNVTTNVARIGDQEYPTLQDALNAANDNDEIKLLEDLTDDLGNITITKSITLEGNGHRISGATSLYMGSTQTIIIRNVKFENIATPGGKRSAIYAESFEGNLTITGCEFNNVQYEAMQIVPSADGAVVNITNNIFNHDTTVIPARYIHIECLTKGTIVGRNVALTVTNNDMLGTMPSNEMMGIYYFTPDSEVDLKGNYFSTLDASVCILAYENNKIINQTLSIYPAKATAGEETDTYTPVAYIHPSTYEYKFYDSTQEAVDAATTGNVVTLLKDTTEKLNITANHNIILDLNGKTLTAPSKENAVSVLGGTLTVKDSTATVAPAVSDDYETVTYESGKIVADSTGIAIAENGSVIIESGTIESKNNCGIYAGASNITNGQGNLTIRGGYIHGREYGVGIIMEGSVLNVEGGVIISDDNTGIGGNGTVGQGGTTINVSGGTIVGHIITGGYIACGIYHPQKGVLNITGGKIYADGGVGVLMRGGELNMTGGEVISTGVTSGKVGDSNIIANCYGILLDGAAGYYDVANSAVNISSNAKVTAKGANTPALMVTEKNGTTGKMVVKGGTFSSEVPEEYCAEGYMPKNNGDGSYSVAIDSRVVSLTDSEGNVQYFENPDDAFKNAKDGDVVKLLKDYNKYVTCRATEGISITFDLNGYTITYNSETIATFRTGTAASVTIIDSSTEQTGSIVATGTKGIALRANYNGSTITVLAGKYVGATAAYTDSGTIYIKAGCFDGKLSVKSGATSTNIKEMKISGGSFTNVVPKEYCAEGYIPTEAKDNNGYYSVEGAFVAKVTDAEGTDAQYFNTLSDAIGASSEGQIVTMLGSIDELDKTLTIDKAIILDLNGKTIKSTDRSKKIMITASATLKNGTLEGVSWGTNAFVKADTDNTTVTFTDMMVKATNGTAMLIGTLSYPYSKNVNFTATGSSFVNETVGLGNYSWAGLEICNRGVTVDNKIILKGCQFENHGDNGTPLKIQNGSGSSVIVDQCNVMEYGSKGYGLALENCKGKVNITNSSLIYENENGTGSALRAAYSNEASVKFTLGEGNTVVGKVYAVGTESQPDSYQISIVAGRFDNGTELPFCNATSHEQLMRRLSLKGGYFKVDVSAQTATGYKCVNLEEVIDGYGYQVIVDEDATCFYTESEGVKTYYDSISDAAKAGSVHIAESYTLTEDDIMALNDNRAELVMDTGVIVSYDGTLAELLNKTPQAYFSGLKIKCKDISLTEFVASQGKIDKGTGFSKDNYQNYSELKADTSLFDYSTFALLSAEKFEAKMNGLGYPYLANAISVATQNDATKQEKEEISLLKDVSNVNIYYSKSSFILDLNGYTIKGTGSNPGVLIAPSGSYYIPNDADITIKNGNITASGSFALATNGNLTGVKLELIDLNVSTSGENAAAVYLPADGEAIISGGLYTGTTGVEIRAGKLTIQDNPTITGGNGELQVVKGDGGSTTTNAALAVAQHTTKKAIEVVIENGTFNGTAAINEADPQENNPTNVSLFIEAGTFNGTVNSADCTKFINGGIYAEDVTEYCVTGKEAVQEGEGGTYIIKTGKYDVVLYSSLADGQVTSIATLTGGGKDIEYQTAVTVGATAMSGYKFVGWYKVTGVQTDGGKTIVSYDTENVISKDALYTFGIEEDTTLVAIYEATKMVTLHVDGANFKVNGKKQPSGYHKDFAVGTEITLDYAGTDTFRYWKNGSDKIVSKASSYTFTIVADTDIGLVVMNAGSGEEVKEAYVEFVSAYDQVMQAEMWYSDDNVSEHVLPTGPSKFGGVFKYWSIDGETEATVPSILEAVKASGRNCITVMPVYESTGNTYTVTVIYPDGTTESYDNLAEGVGKTVIAQEITGSKFSYWSDAESNGTILSYNTEYFIRVSRDITLYAIYDETTNVEPVITMTNKYAHIVSGQNKVAFEATRDIPDEYTLIRHGMLYGINPSFGGTTGVNELIVDGSGVWELTSKDTSLQGVYTANISVGSNKTGIVYARGYMVLKDKNGDIVIYYTDIQSGSFDDLSKL